MRIHSAAPLPVIDGARLPWLSVDQMREVDRIMIEDLGITLVWMMENAGSCLAELARRELGGDVVGRKVVVLAGPGGNGGGGLVAARHLVGAGAVVEVGLAAVRDKLSVVPAEQLAILDRMGVPSVSGPPAMDDPALVVDAILGYSQRDAPSDGAVDLIDWSGGRRVLALDTPSGLELATGKLHSPHVTAHATMTLALPKLGLRGAAAVGALHLAGISVPAQVYRRMGLRYHSPFGEGRLVRVD